MKRVVCILCVLLTLLLVFSGCKGSETAETASQTGADTTAETTAKTKLSLYDLRKDMLAADPSMPEMTAVSSVDEKADALFAYLSDLDYSKVEGYYLAYAADGTAYEVAVVVLKERSDVSELENSLRKHVEGRVNLYKSYAPEQVERAENAEIVSSGRYVALIMCGDQAAVRSVFENGVE